jgi:hypothetical protein
VVSLLLMGPPFRRGGEDATGDRRDAGEGLGGGVSVVSRDGRQVTGDKSAVLETEREKPTQLAGGMECGPYWAELPHRVKARNNTPKRVERDRQTDRRRRQQQAIK